MKNVIVTNNKLDLLKSKFLTFLIVVIGIFLCGSSLKNNIAASKDDFYELKEITDIKISLVEGQAYYQLEADGSVYYFNPTENLNENYDTYYEGKTGYYCGFNNNLYKFVVDDISIVDLVEESKDSAKKAIIFSIVVIALCVGYAAYTIIKILKKKPQEEFEYVEYVMEHNNVTNIEMFKKEAYTRKYASIYQKCLYLGVGVVFIGVLLVMSYRGWFNGISKIIMYCVTALVMIAIIVCLIIFRPSFHHKQLDKYISDYMDYLNNGGNPKYDDHFFEFKKEGLKVKLDDNPLFIDYHELNLYTTVVYSKGAHAANIFICSDLDESKLNVLNPIVINNEEEPNQEPKLEEEDEPLVVETGKNMVDSTPKKDSKQPQPIERDFIIILSSESYNQIRENGIYVRGFDYVVDNLKDETLKHTANLKKRIKVVKYVE